MYEYEIFHGRETTMKMISENGARGLNPKTHKFQIIDKYAKYQIRIDKSGVTGTLLSNKNLIKIAEQKGLIL